VFSVRANGQVLLQDFDVLQEAGGPREVLTREFTLDVQNGPLVVEFTPSQGEAVVSNLKVTAVPVAGP
jgi:beta-galactosidase